jgi:hypothetical protein
MKKCLGILVLLLWANAASAQLAKQRLFKVDPLSFVFKELRVAVEHRAFKDYFWYVAPYGYHQFWLGRKPGIEKFGRPEYAQKYYGAGVRGGMRRYFIPKGASPHGFFVQAHVGVRHLWINNYDAASTAGGTSSLQIVDKSRFGQGCFGGTVGYQWIAGPRKDFCYGFIGGFEKFVPLGYHSSSGTHDRTDITSNWYEFPFLLQGRSGLRLYLGIEVGFAFLQKHLHW